MNHTPGVFQVAVHADEVEIHTLMASSPLLLGISLFGFVLLFWLPLG
jgi:uncharacterized membrane protein YgdD (TMEM256/DUF423 family)